LKKKIKANFFWNSNNLSVYEYACLNSFVKNDFDVDVYSFCNIKLPQGVVLKNASSILDQKEIKKFIHDGKAGCLAAFTDKFRIELQKKNLGWWFDMDVVCLKNSKYFSKLEKGNKFIIGMETNNKINNAVLKISDKNLASHISKKILETGYNFKWGGIGPDLITKILKKEKILYKAQPRYKFYAINYQNFNLLILPKYKKLAEQLTKNSLVTHNYNQIFNRFGIPKNIMPPKNSFLYSIFIEYCPELKKKEYLPETTAYRLLERTNGFKENLYDLFPSLFRSLKKFLNNKYLLK
jgi:hypothetical protein